jgi:3-oxoacyl-[acyl-carrier protein] reductase
MSGRLTGKTAIVTGAASGIGRATVRRFLEEEANVVAVDIDAEALAQSLEGLDAVAALADVTDQSAVERVVGETTDRYGRLDVYVNNAGVPHDPKPLEELTDAEWQRTLDVNLTAFFYAARAVVPVMKEQGSGAIIVTASVAGVRPRPKLAAYCASKGGVIALAKTLALEVGEHGIRVVPICPVATDTPMLTRLGGANITPTGIPLGRFAEPEEIAAAIAFAASDDAAFFTGGELLVDGGRAI